MNLTSRVLGWVAVAGLLATACGTMASPTTLPFSDTFESYAAGPLPFGSTAWSATTGVATVQTSVKVQGSQGCTVTNHLRLNVDTSKNYTNVWVQVYVKPAALSSDPTSIPTDISCAFYVTTGGVLRVRSNDVWRSVATGLNTNNWTGLALHIDYKANKWDIYYTTAGYGSSMTKANPGPLGFSSAVNTKLSQVNVGSEKPTYVDAVVATRAGSLAVGTHSPSNVVVQPISVPSGQNTMIGFLGNTYPLNENTLTGALGRYLMSILGVGDKITIHDANNNINVYVLRTNAQGVAYWDDGGAAVPPANMHVGPGTGVWLDPASVRVIYGFAAYNPNVSTPPLALQGKDQFAQGWTQCAWTQVRNSTANAGNNRWGFSGGVAQAGDRLYIKDKDTGEWYVLYWDAANGRWMNGRLVSDYVMKAAQTFWYFKRHDGTKNWDALGAE